MVLMKRKAGVAETDVQRVLRSLCALKEQIPGILEFTAGANFSERSGGFTHALYARFVDRAALAAYRPHPAHQALAGQLDEVTEGRVIMDYEL